MALTSLKLSHIQLVFKQLVLLYSIRHVIISNFPPITDSTWASIFTGQRKRTGWEYGISASTMSIPTWHPSAYAKDGGIITTASIPWA